MGRAACADARVCPDRAVYLEAHLVASALPCTTQTAMITSGPLQRWQTPPKPQKHWPSAKRENRSV